MHSHPVFVVKHAVPSAPRKPELDPQYIAGRILELVSTDVGQLRLRFYKSAYLSFFKHTGLPINTVYSVSDTPTMNHESMSIGDVYTLSEFGYYSKLYQKVPREINNKEFMIIEQYLDTTPHDTNIWQHQIPTIFAPMLPPIIDIEYKPYMYSLTKLKDTDPYLYEHFIQYLQQNAEVYLNILLNHIPKEKEEIIRTQCRAWTELTQYAYTAAFVFLNEN